MYNDEARTYIRYHNQDEYWVNGTQRLPFDDVLAIIDQMEEDEEIEIQTMLPHRQR